MGPVCTLDKRIRDCEGITPACTRCGFEIKERDRRKLLPLVYCEDGLLRKNVRREVLK